MAHLRHLAIRCHDMEKSRDFYTTVIGWDFLDYRPSRQGLDLTDGVNNITLLQNPPDLVRPTFEEGEEYIHFGVVVDDLSAVEAKVKAAGFTPFNHGDYEPGKRFYFNDQDDVEWEVVSYT